jgi:hypothetical protein
MLMKKLLYVMAVALSLTTPIRATDNWQASCKSASQLARTIMQLRQDGKDMSGIVDSIGKTGDADSQKTATDLVLEAYKEPRYQTEGMQKKSVDDFGNDIYLRCAEELKGK